MNWVSRLGLAYLLGAIATYLARNTHAPRENFAGIVADYRKTLGRIRPDVLQTTVERLVEEKPFWPKVADLRKKAAELERSGAWRQFEYEPDGPDDDAPLEIERCQECNFPLPLHDVNCSQRQDGGSIARVAFVGESQ